MARPRKKDRDLPQRMYRKNGAFWHVARGKWTRLASLDDSITAFAKYAEIESGGTGRTLQDGINRYIADVIPTLSEATQRDYRAIAIFLGTWAGGLQADQIATRHVARLLDEYPHPKRANKIVAVLSSLYSRMIRWGWVSENPCRGVPRNKTSRRTTVPTWLEIQAIKAAMPPQWQAMVDLSITTAIRRGDLMQLRRTDCTDEGLRINVRKTGNEILFDWTPELESIVKRLKAGTIASVWLCPNTKGQKYTSSGFNACWRRYRSKAGMDHIWWHDLRAFALTHAEKAHGKEYAQALAAHASVTTTEIYLRGKRASIAPLSFRQPGLY